MYGSAIWVLQFWGVLGLIVWVGIGELDLVLVNSVVNYISCCVMIMFWFCELFCACCG